MSEKAKKLLERMRQSSAGWKRTDLDRLYLGFGFEMRHGGNHDIFKHSRYKHLRATLPRHTSLAKGYVVTAVKIIDELIELMEHEQENEMGNDEETNE